MPDGNNYGISGAGNVSAGNLAIGPNSRIIDNSEARSTSQFTSPATLAGQLDVLHRAMDQYDGPPDARSIVLATEAEIHDELNQSAPDKGRLVSLLHSVVTAAGPATAVAQAALAIVQVISAIA
jgi:hypothetical protein